jgi:hypothetical protein
MATTDYTLGGARLFFNDGGQDGAAGNGYLDLGNIPTFSIERTIAEIEHFAFIASSLSRQKDLNIVTDIGMSFNFTIDELFSQNWNIILFGNGTTSTVQSGSSIVDEVTTAPILLDRSIFTAETNISNFFLDDQLLKASPYVENTDYQIVNATTGEIKILSTGAITSGQTPLYMTYDSAARTRDRIVPGDDTSIKGSARLEFQGQNGGDITWVINNCEIKPDGSSPISSTEVSESNLILNILVDKVVTPAEPFGFVLHGT